MSIDRRQVALGGIGLGATAAALAGPRASAAREAQFAGLGRPASDFGVRPNADGDQTRALQQAVDATAAAGAPLLLAPGVYRVGRIVLKPGTQIVGVAAQTVLDYAGEDGFLSAEGAGDIRLSGLTLTGGKRPLGSGGALLVARAVGRLTVRDCRFQASAGNGLHLAGCAGAICDNESAEAAWAGIFSIDAKGLDISHNHVHDCANNGIQTWRTTKGEDGTIIAHNRIERIAAEGGGSGQNGNGINMFRADSVLVTGNRIADCAFTAVRANAASNCQMIGNACARLGEVALYAEFGFEGSIIANNLVDGAASGISITNFNEGGRLAVAQGNVIRNLVLRKDGDSRGVGIAVEADTIVTGNVVENAPAIGILIGWGTYLREVLVTGNTVRKARIGIGVSATDGAGYALIANNMISGSTDGAIRAMNLDKPLGRDLAHASAESYRNIAVFGNVGL